MSRSAILLVMTALASGALHACCGASGQATVVFIDESLLRVPDDGMQGELEWSGRVELGHDITEVARIEVTSKGNGGLRICGQEFKVYDDHDDGAVFDPSFVRVMFVDVDNDGYRDLLLCGTVVQTSDSSNERRRTRFRQAYRYDVKVRRFVPW